MLAGDAERVAQLRHGEPVRLPRQQPRGGGGDRVDGARREVDAVPLDDQASAGPAPAARPGRRRPVAAGWVRPPRAPAGRGGRSAGREPRRGGPCRRRRGRRRTRPSTSRSRSSSAATSSPSGPAAAIRAERASTIASTAPGATTHGPTAAGRRSPVTASSSSAVDPAALGARPGRDVARPLRRPHLRRRPDRRHVEDLAAADGLAPAELPQDVAVAGQQRHAAGRGGGARSRADPGAMRRAAEDPHASPGARPSRCRPA